MKPDSVQPSARAAVSHRYPTFQRFWLDAFAAALTVVFTLTGFHRSAHAAVEATWNSGQPGAELDVSLVTFGPGEEYWERFGHNAILVRDQASGVEYSYNYGIFDFDQKDFYLNFLRGRMLYRMAARPFGADLAEYSAEGRWIVEQRLNLSPPQRAKLFAFLEWNRRPENAQYRYQYFRDNCSTRVRDALNRALDDRLRSQSVSASQGFSYRMDALRLMRPDLWLMLGMDAGLGASADQRLSFWDESFVPMVLMRELREITVNDDVGRTIALVADESRLNKGVLPDPPAYPPYWMWRFLALGLSLASVAIFTASKRWYAVARLVFAVLALTSSLVFGLGGLLLAGLWAGTEHEFAWYNENLLLFNPLCLLLLPAWFGSLRTRWQTSASTRAIAVLIAVSACIAFFVKVLPWFTQDNRAWIALILPLHVAFAITTFMQPKRLQPRLMLKPLR